MSDRHSSSTNGQGMSELRNVLERAAILCEGAPIDTTQLTFLSVMLRRRPLRAVVVRTVWMT